MTATIAELTTPQTVEQIFAMLLAVYQANGFPTTAWQTGGLDRTRTMAIATALQDISANYIPSITAGGLLDFAEALENVDWLRLLAEQNFNLPYNPASFTVGDVTLTAGSTGYTISAGQITIIIPATGNRYINTTGGALAASGSLVCTFVAEFAGAQYNDPSSSTISLVSALPGVMATNPATDYTDVAQVGAGVGTVTPGGSPVGPHQVTIRIDSTGNAGAVSWSYSVDAAAYVSAGIVTTGTNLAGTGISATLADGSGGTNFIEGDTYLFNTPGSWITTQGSDDESSPALATRCRNRWRSLSYIPTNGYYELLATSTPDVGSQVTQVIVLPDEFINDVVNIIVAGPEGVLPPATVAAIQAFIDPRAIGTDNPTVRSPTTLDITFAATVTVTAAALLAAQDAAQAASVNYVDEGGINATYRLAKITEFIMEISGVQDISGVTINGVAANLTLGSVSSFVVGSFSAANYTWITTA